MIKITESLSFDDVLLVPKYSDIKSRKEVDLSISMVKGFKFTQCVVPANMRDITELAMAKFMYDNKSLSIFHRFTDFENQLKWLDEIKTWGPDAVRFVGFSTGVRPEYYNYVDQLINNGAQIICVDVAHGDSLQCVEMTKYIAVNYPNVLLISGNVATSSGADRIWSAGADICRVGIGGGSICLTRINAGNGIPSMTSLTECAASKKYMEAKLNRKLFIMQDGGCKTSGDIVKALCFADMCMIGNLLSATDETPGEIIERNETRYKKYVGSSTHRGDHKEGVEALKKYKGPAREVIQALSEGIKSGCSYQGVRNLEDLKIDPHFIKITLAGLKESHAHDLDIIES